MNQQPDQSHARTMKHPHSITLSVIALVVLPFLVAGQEAAPVGVRSITGTAVIEGAFGVTLGDQFTPDPKARIEQGEHQGGYRFTPQNPNPQLSQYIVFLTPNSHRVCRIVGVAAYELSMRDEGIRFAERLGKYLQKKYGQLAQDNRYISVSNSYQETNRINIKVEYGDSGIQRIADHEETANDLQGFNGDGL